MSPVNDRSIIPLQLRHNERDVVSDHQPHDRLLNRLFGRRSKKISKLRVTDLCGGNSPGTGEFPTQRASNAENVSIWWRHHDIFLYNVMIHLYPNFSGYLGKPPLTLGHVLIASRVYGDVITHPYQQLLSSNLNVNLANLCQKMESCGKCL